MEFGGIFKARYWTIHLFLLTITTLPFCWCLEELQQELFFSPRNFNPHPYEHEVARVQDIGPVVFPQNPGDDDPQVNNRYNVITIDSIRRKYPVDYHPYLKVSQKIKYLLTGKHNSKENQVDSELYDALAEHGAKVLTYSPQELKDYGGSGQSQRKKNYAFSYKVLDRATGDDFSHSQIRSSKATNGEYRVKLPDGRVQVVSYKADDDGYKADVKYEDDPDATQQKIIHAPIVSSRGGYVPQKVDVQRIPVRELKPVARPKIINSYDFVAEEGGQLLSPLNDPNVVLLEQVGPTEIPVNYVDVGASPFPTSVAYLPREPVNHGLRKQPKVEIYTTNARDHISGSYTPTTAATPFYDSGPVVRYTSTPVPPTIQAQIVNFGDQRYYNPTAAPPYGSRQQQHTIKNVVSSTQSPNGVGDSQHKALAAENDLPEGIYIVGKR